MAIEPLYNSKSEVLQNIRMSDTSDADTLVMIDQAIADVRLGFYRRLTLDRALELAALPTVENPTTINETLRGVAESVEINWVNHVLITKLPAMFIETQFSIQENFDDVPLTRDSASLQKFLATLWSSIETGLGLLIIPVNDNAGDYQAFSNGRPTLHLLGQNTVGLTRSTI